MDPRVAADARATAHEPGPAGVASPHPPEGGAPSWLVAAEQTTHVHRRRARPGRTAPWPAWVPDRLREALGARGIEALWEHQATAAAAAFAGRSVAIATGTASGKSLAYLLPIATAGIEGRLGWEPPARAGLRVTRRPTALYLSPTKALAHDQRRACAALALDDWRVGTLDGDSDPDERRFAREFASLVLTNPDMLHRSVLPQHARFARLLGSLAYVVVDEAHRYTGVFGAHVASVLRRLRRLAHHYGARPALIVASATMASPDAVAATLTGETDVLAVTEDASPRAGLDVVCWRPHGPHTQTVAALLARLADQGQTLAFTTSRLQAELVALRARELSRTPASIAAYRGGYLAAERRALEAALSDGRLRGVACTNALELGIDIAGMDAVISAGFPGTLAAFWQQVGRAGRSGRHAVAVLAAREDPLDAYLVEHPELIFDRPVEPTVVHPENPYVLGPHLAAAAQERALTPDDARWFGPRTVELTDRLAAQGVLRRRSGGWFWTHPGRAVDSIDLRSAQGRAFEVVDERTGAVIGQVDPSAADRTVHPGAVYVHQGETWVVGHTDDRDRIALALRAQPGYYTQPQSHTTIRILTTDESRALGAGLVQVGTIELASQVIGYLRRDAQTGDVWDSTPLDRPVRTMTTRATWWTLPPEQIERLGVAAGELPGAVHAAEHTAIGLLPALIPCDRWDVGGLSTVLHPDTGLTTVFVHDGLPGGAGFAEAGHRIAERWWAATLERLESCPCAEGCPACVVSPKCGNGNSPLDKDAAARLLRGLTRPG